MGNGPEYYAPIENPAGYSWAGATKQLWDGLGKAAGATGNLVEQAVLFITLDKKSALWNNLGKGWDYVSKETLNLWDEYAKGEPSVSVLDKSGTDIFSKIGVNPHQGRKYAEETWASVERIKCLKNGIDKLKSDDSYRLKLHKSILLVQHLKSIDARRSFQLEARGRLVNKRAELVEKLEKPDSISNGHYNANDLPDEYKGLFPKDQQNGTPVQDQINEVDKQIGQYDMDISDEVDMDTYAIDPNDGSIKPVNAPKKRVKIREEIQDLKMDVDFFTQTQLITQYVAEFKKNVGVINNSIRNDTSGLSLKILNDGGLTISTPAPSNKGTANPNANGQNGGQGGQGGQGGPQKPPIYVN